MKVLIACEESQEVTKAFRSLGIEAYSCDVQPCSGGHPEWHIQGCALEQAYSGEYTLMIGHPPCTFLSKAGARWMFPKGELSAERYEKAKKAKEFFMKLMEAPIDHIALENPVPLKIVELPQFTQAIQPYQFGHPFSKKTLLWLKGLPPLEPTNLVEKQGTYLPSNTGGAKRGLSSDQGVRKAQGSKLKQHRSKTFSGIAEAMADQWSRFLLNKPAASTV